MATKSEAIQQHVIDILREQDWLSLSEIYLRMPGRLMIQKYDVRNAITQLLNKSVVKCKSNGSRNAYCLIGKSETILERARRLDKEGLPWIKLPRTPEGCRQIVTLLTDVRNHPVASKMYGDETIQFLDSNIAHVKALEDRLK